MLINLNVILVVYRRLSRCLGLKIDYQLNWNYHVSEVIKAFTQKLNLLKSLYVLPEKGREDFYFKVILPSVTPTG